MEALLDKALWLAGIGHFVILIASFQAPFRLGWKEDLAKVSRFNRKIFLVSSGYVFYCIISFGILTLVYHDAMLQGESIAAGLSLFIGIFWGMRVLIDLVYGHQGWPKGLHFVVGHILLTGLFLALSSTYLFNFFWHS